MPPLRYGGFFVLNYSDNVVTGMILSYFLILGVYAWALYIRYDILCQCICVLFIDVLVCAISK